MFQFILQMVLTVAVGSIKNPGHVTSLEWTLVQDVYDALGSLIAKKPSA